MAVVFDSVGFSAELDSLKSKVSDKLKSELKTAMTEESKSQLDGKNPNDAQAYTNFYNRVNPAGNFKKNIIPEDVYKAIMLESAVRDNTISKGFDIGNLDGKTVSAISSWFQGIFGKKTMTVGKYKVTMQNNYSAQVTSPSGSVYSLTWTLDNTAKKALKAYIADLKTYLSDYRYQIYGEIIKDGLSPLINEFIAEVAEEVDSAREKLINNFHEWALNKAADVAIDKILPKTYKQIKAVAKNYKTFVSKLNDLKTYAKTVKDDSIISNKKYTAFVTAYNNLGIGNYVDVVANYLSYEFLETESGIFGQNKALITGTDSDNKISASGSYVTIKGGGGNDFISASGSKSRISGDAGNDKVLLEGSQGSINGGTGSDSIVVDGERNTVLGGANEDYIALFKDKNTITGGKGNDTIFFVGVGESVIKYNKGDGSDTIIGYDATDTIKITGNYSTQTSGQDVIITVDNGSIRLVGASGKQININNTNKVIGKFTYDEATTYTLPSFYSGTNYVKYGTNGDDTNWGGYWGGYYYYSSNYTGNVFINMLAGNDTIHNGGDNVTIDGGADNDSISNNGDNVTINGGSGNDSISSSTKTVWNSQSRKYETVTGSDVIMNGGDGDDTISNSYKKTTYGQSYGGDNFIADGGNGNDSITNYGNNATLFSGNGDDTILNRGDSVTIDSGAGNDNILNSGNDISINSGAGNDYIDSWSNGDSVMIDSGTGNDTISSGSDNSLIQSGAGNDLIDNRGDNSTIDAGSGNDSIFNSGDNVSINGGDGNDSIEIESLYYGENVSIDGGAGNDLITINKYASWNNLIEYKSGEGNDTIIGFNETSTLSIAGGGYVTTSGEDVIIKSGSGSVLLSDARLNETLNIVFSDGSDTSGALFVKGSAKSDNIGNRISNSTITALDGDDNIWNGASTFSKNATNVSIIGGNGNDSITNTYGDFSTIDGGAGNDTLHNDRADNVIVNGGAGNDSIYNYNNHNSSIYGGTGDDTLAVNYGENIFMDGGNGNDYISNGERHFYTSIYGSKNSTILGGKGNDTIYNEYNSGSYSYEGSNVLFKYNYGDGNDIIYGFDDSDTLSISGGSYSTTNRNYDVIVTVGEGKISLIGAARYNANIIRQVSTTTLTNKNSANITIGANIDVADASTRTKAIKIVGNIFENTIVGGSKSDSLYGGKGADSLIGNAGNDKIYGEAGNDILLGGKGNDIFIYSAGNDTITDYAAGDKISLGADVTKTTLNGSDVVFTIGKGSLTIQKAKDKTLNLIDSKGKEYSTLVSDFFTVTNSTKSPSTIESFVKTVDASSRTKVIAITGNALANSISGGSKNDSIFGAAGNDSIIGNAGNDKLYGDAGNDILLGGKGNDSLWGGVGNDTLTGNDGNDFFIYESGKDVISDYTAGQDKILIAGGKISKTSLSSSNVLFTIGKGSLTVKNAKGKTIRLLDSTGKASSTVVGAQTLTNSNKASVTIAADMGAVDASKRTKAISIMGNALANTICGGSKNDSIFGAIGNDSILGNTGNDKLYGEAGNDIIIGGKGNDSLNGGAGNDSLWGDAGKDTFIYTANEGTDKIFDYETGDLLKILNADGSDGYFKSSKYSGGDLTLTINGGGKIIFEDVVSSTKFNINGSSYNISGSKLVKK